MGKIFEPQEKKLTGFSNNIGQSLRNDCWNYCSKIVTTVTRKETGTTVPANVTGATIVARVVPERTHSYLLAFRGCL